MTRHSLPLLSALLLLAACADRDADLVAPTDVSQPRATRESDDTRRLEGLARRFARALKDPAFRANVHARIAASPFPEGKIQLQRFLAERNREGVRALASANAEAAWTIDSVAGHTQALEVYLPVKEHRRQWQGDERVLVGTAAHDDEVPVAFDLNGGRHFLDPTRPPRTPVLAVVPVETDFDHPPDPSRVPCVETCGGGTSLVASGLYLTKSHLVETFEGWLKGNPEIEVHIMGQKASSDSLTKYQCAGEHASGGYIFDQNSTDWSGSVLLFSQTQINSYKQQHPNQALRIVLMEDDDTACEMKIAQDRWSSMIAAAGPAYKDFTGAIDNGSVPNYVKGAKSVLNFLSKLASWIKSNDDLIGNAIEDKIAQQYASGYNWVIKSDGNKTNGWLKLEMK